MVPLNQFLDVMVPQKLSLLLLLLSCKTQGFFNSNKDLAKCITKKDTKDRNSFIQLYENSTKGCIRNHIAGNRSTAYKWCG